MRYITSYLYKCSWFYISLPCSPVGFILKGVEIWSNSRTVILTESILFIRLSFDKRCMLFRLGWKYFHVNFIRGENEMNFLKVASLENWVLIRELCNLSAKAQKFGIHFSTSHRGGGASIQICSDHVIHIGQYHPPGFGASRAGKLQILLKSEWKNLIRCWKCSWRLHGDSSVIDKIGKILYSQG